MIQVLLPGARPSTGGGYGNGNGGSRAFLRAKNTGWGYGLYDGDGFSGGRNWNYHNNFYKLHWTPVILKESP